jgi:hypothetical protein
MAGDYTLVGLRSKTSLQWGVNENAEAACDSVCEISGLEAGSDGWGELEGFVHELAVTTLQARFERGMDQGIAPVCTQAALIPFMTVFFTLWNKTCVDTNDFSGVVIRLPCEQRGATAKLQRVARFTETSNPSIPLLRSTGTRAETRSRRGATAAL